MPTRHSPAGGDPGHWAAVRANVQLAFEAEVRRVCLLQGLGHPRFEREEVEAAVASWPATGSPLVDELRARLAPTASRARSRTADR